MQNGDRKGLLKRPLLSKTFWGLQTQNFEKLNGTTKEKGMTLSFYVYCPPPHLPLKNGDHEVYMGDPL